MILIWSMNGYLCALQVMCWRSVINEIKNDIIFVTACRDDVFSDLMSDCRIMHIAYVVPMRGRQLAVTVTTCCSSTGCRPILRRTEARVDGFSRYSRTCKLLHKIDHAAWLETCSYWVDYYDLLDTSLGSIDYTPLIVFVSIMDADSRTSTAKITLHQTHSNRFDSPVRPTWDDCEIPVSLVIYN